MTEKDTRTPKTARKIVAVVLFVIAGAMLAAAVFGFIQQGTQQTRENMASMRDQSVLHAASTGVIETIGREASKTARQQLRKRSDFRKLGLNEVQGICDQAKADAIAEAEKAYGNPVIQDTAAFRSAVDRMTDVISASSDLKQQERAVFADFYKQLMESVPNWQEAAPENADDQAVAEALIRVAPDLGGEANRHLLPGFVNIARNMALKEREEAEKEQHDHMLRIMSNGISNWSAFENLEDDDIWAELTREVPDLASYPDWKEVLIGGARECADASANGRELPSWTSSEEEEVKEESEVLVRYDEFIPSAELKKEMEEQDATYQILQGELGKVIPGLENMEEDLQQDLRVSIEKILGQGNQEFDIRYRTYVDNGGEKAATTGQWQMKLAALAKYLLLAGIAVLLLGLVLFFWKSLTMRLGVPRTIIILFFMFLCLLAEGYRISVGMMLGNVLERMTMYGILVLAMMPGIQCGIGLNMGMTIGCISGLLGIMIALQYNMTGFPAMLVACGCGIVVALPLGWAYSKLLNRMKGNEMTISTYVGFSFVSLMCIGWMLLPFDNPKIIWLLSGKGLRVTHGLLGSFAHILDNLLSFKALGIKIPTGGLLFLGVCCLLMWIFTRSKTGIAMKAVGSNPRFAEASGISVNRMRTIGTVLSTVIAAVGIIIYSQAFGYAQLYTAPKQLGFIASSAILIGGASVTKAKVSHVLLGVFLFEGVLVFGQQIANSAIAGGGLSEVMRILISNGIILYALTQSGGGRRE